MNRWELMCRATVVITLLCATVAVSLGVTWTGLLGWAFAFALISAVRYWHMQRRS